MLQTQRMERSAACIWQIAQPLADLLTAAHEYGHFVDGYVNCNQTFSIDCSEVFSQALEYLTLGSTSLGFSRAAELRQYKLYDSLETFLTQACYYAFECKAYALPDSELTVGKLNELFAECCVDFGLFDELTVTQFLDYMAALKGLKNPKAAIREVVAAVNLEEKARAKIRTLSGGQRQRVGIARALANDPDVLLMDEPFSALDPLVRRDMQFELLQIQRKLQKTVIFITHDMDEAIKIADRICIMKDGRILQYDTPEEILRRPANDFVANFVGANRIWGSPKFIRVEDFMIRHPVTCDASLSAERCITKLTMRHVDTLLVTGKEGQLLGIVNRKSLYANHRPDKPAGEIMLPPKCTAHPEDSILDVLKMIDRTDASNVPVVDALGRVVGLLTNSNLVSTLSRQYLEDMTEEVREND